MKREIFLTINACTVLLVLSIFLSSYVSADASSNRFTVVDRAKIQNQLSTIANGVNSQKIDLILNTISKDSGSRLKLDIINALKDKSFHYEQSIKSFSELAPGKVRVDCVMNAASKDTTISDRQMFFVFEKYGNNWLVTDTDFHKQLTQSKTALAFGDTINRFYTASIPILVLLEIFWLWMVVDVSKKKFSGKMYWLVFVLLLNFMAAAIYFFSMRKTLKDQERFQGTLYQSQTIQAKIPQGSQPVQQQQARSSVQTPQVQAQFKKDQVYSAGQQPRK